MHILESQRKSFNIILKKTRTNNNNSDIFIDLPNDNIPNVLIGDVFDCLRKIPDKSISVVVTSPPYWNLRDYEFKGQIGQEENPQDYVNKMVSVGNELLRILKDNGAYFLNIGDSYVDKNLQMIPQRVAIGMQQNGWLLRNQLIWYKPNHMPSPVKSRFTNTYEPIFFFSKNDWEKDVCFDIDSIRIPHKSEQMTLNIPKNNYNGKFKGNEKNVGASPGGRISVSGEKYTLKRKYNVSQKEICDYLRMWRDKKKLNNTDIIKYFGESYKHTVGHWFRKDAGGSLPSVDDWMKLKQILEFDNKYDIKMTVMTRVLQTVQNHPKGKNPGDLFFINTAKTPFKHFAVFPEEIPEIAIKSCCPKNGIVLDPFAGSGTTGLVAIKLKRKSIMIDIQPNFIDIMKKRIEKINIIGDK